MHRVLYLCQHCLVFIRLKNCVIVEKLDISFIFTGESNLKTCVIVEKLDISLIFTGESNLKQRTAVSLDDTGVFVPQSKLKIECETPNAVLNKFNGYM